MVKRPGSSVTVASAPVLSNVMPDTNAGGEPRHSRVSGRRGVRILPSEEMVAEFVGLEADAQHSGIAKTRRVVTEPSEEPCLSPLVVSSSQVWLRHRSPCRW